MTEDHGGPCERPDLEVNLVDVVDEDGRDGDHLGGAGRRHGHEDEQHDQDLTRLTHQLLCNKRSHQPCIGQQHCVQRNKLDTSSFLLRSKLNKFETPGVSQSCWDLERGSGVVATRRG